MVESLTLKLFECKGGNIISAPEKRGLYNLASDLHPLHWERLARRPPEISARAAGCDLVEGCFHIDCVAKTLAIDPQRRAVVLRDEPGGEPGYQRSLAALTYLAGATEGPASGAFVSPRELPGGASFFRGPHSLPTDRLASAFGPDLPSLAAAAKALGGRIAQGGDLSFIIPGLPKIPIQIVYWRGDEEFSAASALLVDARSHLHLPLDALWALLNVAVSSLTGRNH